MSIIEVKQVAKIFGAHPQKALELVKQGVGKTELLEKHKHALGLYDINLEIEAGEIFVIMGLSGSGKSTLIRHFNRLIEPTAGQILVNGEDVTAMDRATLREFRRRTMSMVFQHFGLMPHRTVLENVAYGCRVRGEDKASAHEQALKWLELVGLSGFEAQYPTQLSGGQQQRVGLARALATDTDILLMDEAFSALDPLIRSQMQTQLLELQAQLQKTIVFITHDLSEALRIGTRIAILRAGKVAQVGTPQEILLNPANDYVRAFVKDVNLSSVLNAATVMRTPQVYLQEESPAEALVQMRRHAQDWAWVQADGVWKGLVTASMLEHLLAQGEMPRLADIAEKTATVKTDTSIDELLPMAVGNRYPIPVLNKRGELAGVVHPDILVALLEDGELA